MHICFSGLRIMGAFFVVIAPAIAVTQARAASEYASDSHTGTIAFIALCALAIYFLPTVVASNRRHQNLLAIFMTNLLLGWTFLGWVAALIWACTYVPKRVSVRVVANE